MAVIQKSSSSNDQWCQEASITAKATKPSTRLSVTTPIITNVYGPIRKNNFNSPLVSSISVWQQSSCSNKGKTTKVEKNVLLKRFFHSTNSYNKSNQETLNQNDTVTNPQGAQTQSKEEIGLNHGDDITLTTNVFQQLDERQERLLKGPSRHDSMNENHKQNDKNDRNWTVEIGSAGTERNLAIAKLALQHISSSSSSVTRGKTDGLTTETSTSSSRRPRIRVVVVTPTKESAKELQTMLQHQLADFDLGSSCNNTTNNNTGNKDASPTDTAHAESSQQGQLLPTATTTTHHNQKEFSYYTLYRGRQLSRDVADMQKYCSSTEGVPTIWIGTPSRLRRHLQYSSLNNPNDNKEETGASVARAEETAATTATSTTTVTNTSNKTPANQLDSDMDHINPQDRDDHTKQNKNNKDESNSNNPRVQKTGHPKHKRIIVLRHCLSSDALFILEGLDQMMLDRRKKDHLQRIVGFLSPVLLFNKTHSLVFTSEPLSLSQIQSVLQTKNNKNNKQQNPKPHLPFQQQLSHAKVVQSAAADQKTTRRNWNQPRLQVRNWSRSRPKSAAGYPHNHAASNVRKKLPILNFTALEQLVQAKQRHRSRQKHVTGPSHVVAAATATKQSSSTLVDATQESLFLQVLPRDKVFWTTVQALLRLIVGSYDNHNNKSKILVMFSTQEQVDFFARLFNLHMGCDVLEWPRRTLENNERRTKRRRELVRNAFLKGGTRTGSVLLIAAPEMEEFLSSHYQNSDGNDNDISNAVTHVVQVGLCLPPNLSANKKDPTYFLRRFISDEASISSCKTRTIMAPRTTSHDTQNKSQHHPASRTSVWILADWEASVVLKADGLPLHWMKVLETLSMFHPKGHQNYAQKSQKEEFLLDPFVEEMRMQVVSQMEEMRMLPSSQVEFASSSDQQSSLPALMDAARAMSLSTLAASLSSPPQVIMLPVEGSERNDQQYSEKVMIDYVTETWSAPLGLSNPVATLTHHEARRYRLEPVLSALLSSSSSSLAVGKRQIWQRGRQFNVGIGKPGNDSTQS
ncbi:hypothetical protein ACA910_002095 [Epithemia clementina (nom. ined.)]